MSTGNGSSNLINSNISPSGKLSNSGMISVKEQLYTDKGFTFSDITDFLQIIKEIVQNSLNNSTPKATLGKIIRRVSDIRYDVEVLSGNESKIIHNILNNTRFDYKEGDYVEIFDTQNNLNTAYISCARSIPLETGYHEITDIRDTL